MIKSNIKNKIKQMIYKPRKTGSEDDSIIGYFDEMSQDIDEAFKRLLKSNEKKEDEGEGKEEKGKEEKKDESNKAEGGKEEKKEDGKE